MCGSNRGFSQHVSLVASPRGLGEPGYSPGLSSVTAPQHEHGGGWLETSSPLPSLARAVEALGLLPPSRVIYCLVCRVSAT